MIRTFVWPALGAVLGMAVADPAFAHLPLRTQGTRRPPVINVIDTAKELDANQLSMFVTNIGSFAYDLGAQNSGLEFPKGTGNGHHLQNRSSGVALYLEVGSRNLNDITTCSDIDMKSSNADGRFVHKDGSPYP